MPLRPLASAPIGVLASGGLDSSILVADLLRQGRAVQPFHLETGLAWEQAELAALRRFLTSPLPLGEGQGEGIPQSKFLPLVTLQMPLADIYTGHWSLTGNEVPDAESPDEAVYLPGRNALLLVKPAIWCQRHGIGQLALAPLGTSPFEDASPAFLRDLQAALNRGSPSPIEFLLPFAGMNKRQVMQLGRELHLELTFSCIAPVRGRHCGRCNKCAERQAAFREAEIEDKTEYAA